MKPPISEILISLIKAHLSPSSKESEEGLLEVICVKQTN